MRILLPIFLILFFAGSTYSDELRIPFSCWPKELKTHFAQNGKKLDLNSADRTDDSWGYILNKGKEYVIYTYQSVTKEEFQMIQDIVFKVDLEKNK